MAQWYLASDSGARGRGFEIKQGWQRKPELIFEYSYGYSNNIQIFGWL